MRKYGLENLEPRVLLAADLWQTLASAPVSPTDAQRTVQAEDYRPLSLDTSGMRDLLTNVPLEFSGQNGKQIELPRPDGTFETFAIYETQVMAPELAAQFSEIQTFAGYSLDNPGSNLRMDMTPQGFHAQVLTAGGSYYIDPYYHLEDQIYTSYFRSDAEISEINLEAMRTGAENLQDHHGDEDHLGGGSYQPKMGPQASPAGDSDMEGESVLLGRSGELLRTYRIAIAATGEYTQYHGGTVVNGLAAITTALNRVNAVYENELAIRFELVANNDEIVYTDPAADPYNNLDTFAMLEQNHDNLEAVIGLDNFDIGHVFSTSDGGVAALGSVGDEDFKGQGVTGLPQPIGDPFYVDYVAHEIGHQFAAWHTFAYCGGPGVGGITIEPGSGVTIMAYAGLCGPDDLQLNSIPQFHAASFDQIINFVDNVIPGVGTTQNTLNSVPTVDAGGDHYIPANTPFALTASGSDANNDTLSYSWEQMDVYADATTAQQVVAGDVGEGPIFRVFDHTTNPTRTFPQLPDLINHTDTFGNALPTTERDLNFRVTVRDNRFGAGGVNTDDMLLTVVDTGATFQLTSLNTFQFLSGGSQQLLTWDVAGTDQGLIDTQNVRITMSTDGGYTYPTTVLNSTDNDGSQIITIPNIATNEARFRIEGIGNVFFNISAQEYDDPERSCLAGCG
ncbi:MAG: reprolysin-like metallopeptidase [Pirellulaceae bacterium]